ncbi:agmatine deiminase family protein, partial [Streptomyces sp. NPDC059506]|uniref:agmatine deiminase family protein n=1 Tax=Streptomyces sp. NPDC059506 TaxID=3347751 RepID=UPI0036BF82DF
MTPPAFRMPAEWEPHERTWMAWPRPNPTFAGAGELAAAREAWAAVARAVRRFEPVTVVAAPGDAAGPPRPRGGPRSAHSDARAAPGGGARGAR